MDTPEEPPTAALIRHLLNPTHDELQLLLDAPFVNEPHLTPLHQALSGWLARHALDTTRRTYATDITGWLLWLAATGQTPLDDDPTTPWLGPHTFEAYLRHLQAARDVPRTGRWSPHSIHRKISVVSSFYTYATLAGYIPRNPRKGFTMGPRAVTEPRLTPDHLERLEHAADNPPPRSPTATRGPAIVRLLKSGLRPGEIARAEMRDLSLETNPPTLTVRHGPHADATPRDPTVVTLLPEAVDALYAHFAATGRPGHHTHVLRTGTGNPLDEEGIRVYLYGLCRRAHIPQSGGDVIRIAYRAHRTPDTP